MREIILSADNIQRADNNAEFILLGADETINVNKQAVLQKIQNNSDPLPGFWGTLGMADNTALDWEGKLVISSYGNDNSAGETLEEIKLIKDGRSEIINKEEGLVLEKFISFENVTFPSFPNGGFTYEEIPRLRLTVMVGKDEGALVFYEYRSDDGEAAVEYILPQSTTEFTTTQRDRLNYIFPILPNYTIQKMEGNDDKFMLTDAEHKHPFVVKVLTFKRDNLAIEKLISRGAPGIHVPDKDHALLKFNTNTNAFDAVGDGSAIDVNLKTLFLIHGTFSSTAEAFQGLMEKDVTNTSWLQKQITNGKYGQIIGFDHPTITEDAEANIKALVNMLGAGFVFNAEVDIITHSRGGLVGKYIAINTPQIPIRKGALVACANGVGYFTAGWQIAKFLSIFKIFSKAAGSPLTSFVAGLAQFSAEYFLKQPGARLMTPGDPLLKAIATVAPRNNTQYKPIIGDFTKEVVANDNFFKKYAQIGLDEFIKLFLGKEHDWVVGTKEQYLLNDNSYYAPPYNADNYINYNIISARHSDYFYHQKCPAVFTEIEGFLEEVV